MTSINREFKDSLFRKLFGTEECKSNTLELYNALSGRKLDDPDEIQITTIENVIYFGRKNDVSFMINDEMELWEHQSTTNQNMPMRGLLYFSRLCDKLITEGEIDLYDGIRRMFPTPHYFVFYFGPADRPEREILRLSDSFLSGPGDIEVTVTILNCNEGRNEAIMKACKALREYAHLLALVQKNRTKQGMFMDDAVNSAVKQCISEGILADYLQAHRAEVEEMLFTIEDEERAMRVHEETIARRAHERGLKEGISENQAMNLRSIMKNAGCSLEEAFNLLGIPEDAREPLRITLAS